MSFLARLSLANRGLVALMAIIVTGVRRVRRSRRSSSSCCRRSSSPPPSSASSYPGAGPEIIEQQITKPIEDAVKGVDGLDNVSSTTSEGSRQHPGARSRSAPTSTARSTSCSTSINRIQPPLPDSVEPTIFAGSTDDIPAIVLAASSGGDETRTGPPPRADRPARVAARSRASAT